MSDAGKILKDIKEKDVRYVDLRFTDTKGRMQHVTFDVDLVDEEIGDTAAHVAVSWGRLDAVAWLLVPVWKSNLRRVRDAAPRNTG